MGNKYRNRIDAEYFLRLSSSFFSKRCADQNKRGHRIEVILRPRTRGFLLGPYHPQARLSLKLNFFFEGGGGVEITVD
jgi:hypothetical protein